MGNLLSYSGIVTKIRAMQAKLLTDDHFRELAELRSVSEVVSYLKRLPAYSKAFENIDENMLHRGDVEKILVQSLYNDYSKLYRFSGIEHQRFLKLYLKRYEVDLINYCFRIVCNHYAEPFDLNHKKDFFDQYSQISIDRLITSKTTEELVSNLQGTEYYAPLKILQESDRAVTLFDYDLALDLYVFTSVWKERKKVLKGTELEIFTRDCGTKIDLLNLQWIYRAKKYYHMTPAQIYSFIIPVHFHIKLPELKTLIECDSLDDFINLLPKTYYGRRYDWDETFTLEKIYADFLCRLYCADRRNHPYSIASINTYLFLKEEELKKITTVLECIRYGLAAQETLKYIGGVRPQ